MQAKIDNVVATARIPLFAKPFDLSKFRHRADYAAEQRCRLTHGTLPDCTDWKSVLRLAASAKAVYGGSDHCRERPRRIYGRHLRRHRDSTPTRAGKH